MLSPREEQRIGGALAVAVGRIEERLTEGDQPRSDGLFDPGADPDGLLEGSLLTAARSYDQKKVPYIGAFYASLVFEEEVSAPTAHFLLHLLDRLTYRQLCALAYYASEARADERLDIQSDAREEGIHTSPTLVAELGDLANFGLIGFSQDAGGVANPLATMGGGDITAYSAVRTVPTELGEDLVRLAELEASPDEALNQVAEALRGQRS
jgi:hypothetical protein